MNNAFKVAAKASPQKVEIVKTVLPAQTQQLQKNLQTIVSNLTVEDIALLAKVADNFLYRTTALAELRKNIN